jgi:predicted GIY-YIG superfamily endonuclease
MFYIYKLTDGEKDYYGQTQDWERRFREHKAPKCRCLSRLLDKSKMKIHIIHRLYTQEEADKKESFYQLNFECVNNNITGRTKKEYNKKYKKQRQ